MMAAAAISENNSSAEVTIIEQNSVLGKKVRLTGGGRCNVTTGIESMAEILKRYPRGRNFIRYALYEFPPAKVMEWFEGHGVPLKTEADLRVFPKSDKSDDIVAAFERICESSDVKILFKTVAVKAEYNNGRFNIHLNNGLSVMADSLLISTGGRTGAIHNGYELAKSLGHTITELAPSLCAFVTKETWVKELSGVSFKKANLKITASEEYKFTGPFVFTHRGITGPAVFALSALSAHEKLSADKPLDLYIDLMPETNEELLLQKIQNLISENRKKTFLNILSLLIPKSVAETVCLNIGISDSKISAEVPKKDLIKTAHFIKAMPLTVIGMTAGEEFVTAGGVSLSEVDSKTMQSKICPGLFFAGEALDIDAFTGGFNLQAAWATGRLAGISISKAI